MRKGLGFLMAGLLAVSVAACDRAGNDRPGTEGAAGTSGEGANLSMGERSFVTDQLKEGMKEVELGRLASQRASLPAVQQFGAMMVQEHTKAGNELKQIASQANLKFDEEEYSKDAREDVKHLSDSEGREFDRDYIDMMVKDHQDAVDELQDQAQNAEHAGVKQWAASTLPKVKQHLEQAKQLQDQLKNDNRGTRGQ